jgi:hypothetical protein
VASEASGSHHTTARREPAESEDCSNADPINGKMVRVVGVLDQVTHEGDLRLNYLATWVT